MAEMASGCGCLGFADSQMAAPIIPEQNNTNIWFFYSIFLLFPGFRGRIRLCQHANHIITFGRLGMNEDLLVPSPLRVLIDSIVHFTLLPYWLYFFSFN
jgi:hypothetical protein